MTSEEASKPVRATEYSAIPFSNMQAPNNMHVTNQEPRGVLHRMVPLRTVVAVGVALALCCALIGRESVKWGNNHSYFNKVHSPRAMYNMYQQGTAELPYTRADTSVPGLAQVARTSVLENPTTKDIHRRGGIHMVVNMYRVPSEDISPGAKLVADVACPSHEQITDCYCSSAARDCISATGPDLGTSGCRCEYVGIAEACRRTPRVFAVASCV